MTYNEAVLLLIFTGVASLFVTNLLESCTARLDARPERNPFLEEAMAELDELDRELGLEVLDRRTRSVAVTG